jgi:hypothetical protein
MKFVLLIYWLFGLAETAKLFFHSFKFWLNLSPKITFSLLAPYIYYHIQKNILNRPQLFILGLTDLNSGTYIGKTTDMLKIY